MMHIKLPPKKWAHPIQILASVLFLSFVLSILSSTQKVQILTTVSEIEPFNGITNFDVPAQPLESILPYFNRYAYTVRNKDYLLYAIYVQNTSDTTFKDGQSLFWTAEYINPQLIVDDQGTPDAFVAFWSGLHNKMIMIKQDSIALAQKGSEPISETLAAPRDVLIEFQKKSKQCYTFFGVMRHENKTIWKCVNEDKTIEELDNANFITHEN